MHTRKMNKQIN